MSEERPFVLILLTWLLRALNALFLVVCFPLHKLVSLTAPHVTKEEPDAAARVLRFVLSTLALLLLLSMLGTPPIVAWLLAPTEWLPPSLAAAAALFTVVYGFAVCEKGTKLERPWETPIGAYLRGALVEAPADLLAAVGAALTLLLLVRAPPLLHALRRGPGDDAGPLDGAPAGPNVLGAAARSLPATTSWRTVVAYNLAMSAVDLLISVPAALLLGCCVWRAKEAFGRVRAKADGTLLEEGAQRVELFFQLAAALSDLPFLLLGAIVILSGYRAGGLIKELRDAPSRADWKKIFASHAVSLAADLPALLCGLIVLLTIVRAPLLVLSVRRATTVDARRGAAATQLLLLLLDVPALVSALLIGMTGAIGGTLLAVTGCEVDWSAGPYRIAVLRRALARRPSLVDDRGETVRPPTVSGAEMQEVTISAAADPGSSGRQEPTFGRRLWVESWQHVCALEQAAQLIVDVPCVLAALVVAVTGWRVRALQLPLLRSPPYGGFVHVPLSEVDEVREVSYQSTERTKICRELEAWQETLHSGLVWGSINRPGEGSGGLTRTVPHAWRYRTHLRHYTQSHGGNYSSTSALLDHSPRWLEEGDSMATSGFYYTPRPIITVGPTRYFDVNEERPGAVNEQRLFGGTQRIQVDCADYDRRRANALRVHALLHFGGMIIDLPTALAFVLTLLCPWRAAAACAAAAPLCPAVRRRPVWRCFGGALCDLGAALPWAALVATLAVAAYYTITEQRTWLTWIGCYSCAGGDRCGWCEPQTALYSVLGGLGAVAIAVALRIVLGIHACAVWATSAADRRRVTRQQLALLALDVPYAIAAAVVFLTGYRLPRLLAQRRAALETTRAADPLDVLLSSPPPQRVPAKHPFRPLADEALWRRLKEHGLVCSAAANVVLDAPFAPLALLASLAPWRTRMLCAAAGAAGSARADWHRRALFVKHALLLPLDVLGFAAVAATAVLGPWRLPALWSELRAARRRNPFLPDACLITRGGGDEPVDVDGISMREVAVESEPVVVQGAPVDGTETVAAAGVPVAPLPAGAASASAGGLCGGLAATSQAIRGVSLASGAAAPPAAAPPADPAAEAAAVAAASLEPLCESADVDSHGFVFGALGRTALDWALVVGGAALLPLYVWRLPLVLRTCATKPGYRFTRGGGHALAFAAVATYFVIGVADILALVLHLLLGLTVWRLGPLRLARRRAWKEERTEVVWSDDGSLGLDVNGATGVVEAVSDGSECARLLEKRVLRIGDVLTKLDGHALRWGAAGDGMVESSSMAPREGSLADRSMATQESSSSLVPPAATAAPAREGSEPLLDASEEAPADAPLALAGRLRAEPTHYSLTLRSCVPRPAAVGARVWEVRLQPHAAALRQFAMLIIELPFAVGCVLITLTLVRAVPLHRQLNAAADDGPRRRRVLLSQALLWLLDPLALLSAAVVLPSWRGATLVRNIDSARKLGRGWDGMRIHRAAFGQLASLLLDLPFFACFVLQLAVPWRFVFCAREMLEAGEARSRRRACAWHLLHGFLDVLCLPCYLILFVTYYRSGSLRKKLQGTAGFFSSALARLDGGPPPFVAESVVARLEADYGLALTIRGTKEAAAALGAGQVHLTVVGEPFWDAVATVAPPSAVRLVRTMVLPMSAIPALLSADAFAAGVEDVECTLVLGGADGRFKAKRKAIEKGLGKLAAAGDPPMELQLLYRLSGRRGVLLSVTTTPSALHTAALEGTNLLPPPASPERTLSTEERGMEASIAAAAAAAPAADAPEEIKAAEPSAPSFFDGMQAHLGVLGETIQLVVDLPFAVLALLPLLSGWRTREFVKEFGAAPTAGARRCLCAAHAANTIIDLPFVVLAVFCHLCGAWRTLHLADQIRATAKVSDCREVYARGAVATLLDLGAILVGALTLAGPWRFALLVRDCAAANAAAPRRRAAVQHAALLLLDILCAVASLPLVLTYYRCDHLLRQLRALALRTHAAHHQHLDEQLKERSRGRYTPPPMTRAGSSALSAAERGATEPETIEQRLKRAASDGEAAVLSRQASMPEAAAAADPTAAPARGLSVFGAALKPAAAAVPAAAAAEPSPNSVRSEPLHLDAPPACTVAPPSRPILWLLLRVADDSEPFVARFFVHNYVLLELLSLLIDVPFWVFGAAVVLTGWRASHLLSKLRAPEVSLAAKRAAVGKQFVALCVDLPFVALALLLSVVGFWRAPHLVSLVCAAANPRDRRWIIVQQAGAWLLDVPFVCAFPLAGGAIWYGLRSEWAFWPLYPGTDAPLTHAPLLPTWAAALVVAATLWRVLPAASDAAFRASNAPDRRGIVARQLVMAILDPFALTAALCVALTIYRAPILLHRVLVNGDGFVHAAWRPRRRLQVRPSTAAAVESAPSVRIDEVMPSVHRSRSTSHDSLRDSLARSRAPSNASLGSAGDVSPFDAQHVFVETSFQRARRQEAEAAAELAAAMAASAAAAAAAEWPSTKGWDDCLRCHGYALYHFIMLIVDVPFVAMAAFASLAPHRAPRLWRRLLDGWPLSPTERAQLAAALRRLRPAALNPQLSRGSSRLIEEDAGADDAPPPPQLNLLALPDDATLAILGALDDHTALARASAVCTAWRGLITREASAVDELWRRLGHARFAIGDGQAHQFEPTLPAFEVVSIPVREHFRRPGYVPPAPSTYRVTGRYKQAYRIAHRDALRASRPTGRVETRRLGRPSKRLACAKEFGGLLWDIPHLVLALVLLVSWRAPALIFESRLSIVVIRALIAVDFDGYAGGAWRVDRVLSRSPAAAVRGHVRRQFFCLLLDVPCVVLGGAFWLIHSLLGLTDLVRLRELMEAGPAGNGATFAESLEQAAEARHLEDLVAAAGGARLTAEWRALGFWRALERVPLLRYTYAGLRPHGWALWQALMITLHLFHILCGLLLLCSWRHLTLLREASRPEVTRRAHLRAIVLRQAALLVCDLLAAPLFLAVALTVWRLPTFFSLLAQPAFGRGRTFNAGGAALKAFGLMLLDIWTAFCLLFVLLTVIRAPHALYALGTLGRVFRILWSDLRWQTDDGHTAQALAILADDQAAAHVTDADSLAAAVADGFSAFSSTDASAAWGGGVVFVSGADAAGLGGSVTFAPRSLSLFRPLVFAEARWAAARIHHVLFFPLKALGTLLGIPIVWYFRLRLSPRTPSEDVAAAAIDAAWEPIAAERGGRPPSTPTPAPPPTGKARKGKLEVPTWQAREGVDEVEFMCSMDENWDSLLEGPLWPSSESWLGESAALDVTLAGGAGLGGAQVRAAHGAAAARVGLRAGDIITHIDGVQLAGRGGVAASQMCQMKLNAMKQASPGQTFYLQLLRDPTAEAGPSSSEPNRAQGPSAAGPSAAGSKSPMVSILLRKTADAGLDVDEVSAAAMLEATGGHIGQALNRLKLFAPAPTAATEKAKADAAAAAAKALEEAKAAAAATVAPTAPPPFAASASFDAAFNSARPSADRRLSDDAKMAAALQAEFDAEAATALSSLPPSPPPSPPTQGATEAAADDDDDAYGLAPPEALARRELHSVGVEIRLRSSRTLGVLCRLVHWLSELAPRSLDYWTAERYFVVAVLALPPMLMNEVAVLLALPVHLLAALLTGGFGALWGSAEALHEPKASKGFRAVVFFSYLLQAIALPLLAVAELALLVVPPMVPWAATRSWLVECTLALASAAEGGENDLDDYDAAGSGVVPSLGDACGTVDDAGALLRSLPWYAWVATGGWVVAVAFSWQLAARATAHNALWRPWRFYGKVARRIGATLALRGRVFKLYLNILGWSTYMCYVNRRTGGCLGEVLLLPAVIIWTCWPLAIPAAFKQYIWMLLAAPFALVLLFLATRQIRANWTTEPQYKEDVRKQKARRLEKAEARRDAFVAKAAAAAALPTALLTERLRRIPLVDLVARGNARRASAASGTGGGAAPRASEAAAAPGKWWRDHAGTVAGRDPSLWESVWLPLLDSAPELDAALCRGDAGFPLGDDGEWYIDLTALWDPTDRGRAEETLARWRRRNLPAVAYFGIRRVGEEGYARGARPERFAKREAVNAHETGPALARREWAPAEADWGIEE